mmetsp:Transcript_15583/g.33871  ORF Transcript_15583/g.33871 Transcript_15583/m.33871 type:complete len:221 (+) Transcript_15583:792-1454(+)|eukprot:CAMPEP_0206448870 /NCGR_PEP_ID=MMETSP0324_2-20121206/17752_1 /ASSEMBLY_ACC=CAM_ASM_000836 /TAXON_ID=2866 /ORGANISM="Crypthecodinium cohnii, Strain Seligo" /LENGTH=220 /DNA_ID=CAMNT_0053918141 /DNA_START=853 /DNA_END=1515 /DNA_ORIENTATION=-
MNTRGVASVSRRSLPHLVADGLSRGAGCAAEVAVDTGGFAPLTGGGACSALADARAIPSIARHSRAGSGAKFDPGAGGLAQEVAVGVSDASGIGHGFDSKCAGKTGWGQRGKQGGMVAHNLGVLEEPEVHINIALDSNSEVIVASDGIWEKKDEKDVAIPLFEAKDPWTAARTVVEQARAAWDPRGDIDDITAVVVKVGRLPVLQADLVATKSTVGIAMI